MQPFAAPCAHPPHVLEGLLVLQHFREQPALLDCLPKWCHKFSAFLCHLGFSCLHVQLTLEGADQIFNLLMFWAFVNRKVDIKVIRYGGFTSHHACLAKHYIASRPLRLLAADSCQHVQLSLVALAHAGCYLIVIDWDQHLIAVPRGDRVMVNAVQTWTPRLWPAFLLHPPVWYQHILLSTADTPAGCAPACA